jgi:hypothetical protein
MPTSAPTTLGYQQITQAAFISLLADRLGDSGNVYWSLAELRLSLIEALRTFQAYTGWYRQRASVTVTGAPTWVDLTAQTTVLSYNESAQSLASAICYNLLEPQLSSQTWVGTDQFDLAKLQAALQNRLNRFLGDSGSVISYRFQDSGITPPASRAILSPTIIDIRRLAWVPTGQQITSATVLWRSSEWEMNSFLQGWTSLSSTPQVFSVFTTPAMSVQLAPPPAVTGSFEILSVETGPTIALGSVGTNLLQVPDDFSWGIRWGALADLLSSDGQARDLARAMYCEQRYQEAVELAKTFPSVLQVLVNGAPVWTSSVWELDAFLPTWESQAAGTTSTVGLAGRNLMALSPPPIAGTTVQVDVVANAPLPANDAAFVQIPSDVLPVLLDYAQHLASFKMGGTDFSETAQAHKNLLTEAANYNGRLRQMNFFNDAMRAPGLVEQAEVPRLSVPALTSYTLNG